MIRFISLAVLSHVAQLNANPVINILYGESQKISHGGSFNGWCIHGNVENPGTISKVSAALNDANTVNLTYNNSSTRLAKSGNVILPSGHFNLINAKNHQNSASAYFVNNVQSANSPALPGVLFSPAGRLQNRTNSCQRAHGIWIVKNASSDN